ncbi:MAG: CRISPR-associated protein [Betaproteobacteria bacterium CG2_30_68_42]|nr:MAG: CRISPR-associated protein [Betaproteobacteria bacterium CG2_30_68_42]
MTSSASILFVTVGGSHQPIVTAIRALRPAHVVFFCTGKDPATDRPGSCAQVEGKGLCVKAHPADERPTLPNIPAQCELVPGTWEVVSVPADDLDGCYQAMRREFEQNAARFPDAQRIADYTGGTKTMTSALVLAALEDADITLQLVSGARADLIKVREGTQAAVPAVVDVIRLEREMAPLLAVWGRYAWDEAAAGLSALRTPANASLRAHWQRARDFSRAFAAWDRFDHAGALETLRAYEPIVTRAFPGHYPQLKLLAGGGADSRTEGLRIWDLWLNAKRRAVAGRHDDAVARAYRLLEWTAQWILRKERGWNTDALPADIAREADLAPDREGRYQAALFAAWSLVERHVEGAAARFIREERSAMLDHLQRRNHSILAHGFAPVSRPDWEAFSGWIEARFEPLLRELLKAVGAGNPFGQLPDRFPEF